MLTTKVQPLQRDITLLVDRTLSPKARSQTIARFARNIRDEAKAKTAQVLGESPPLKTFVDGVEGASEDAVNPDRGTIVYQFQLVGEALIWILQMLKQNSPVLTGAYAGAHELLADGTQVDNPSKPPPASEYVFLNTRDYARKVERWDGVYQGVASMAQGRFGNTAKIEFTYRAPFVAYRHKRARDSDNRVPAIIVTPR